MYTNIANNKFTYEMNMAKTYPGRGNPAKGRTTSHVNFIRINNN